jgi:hypothetical protein
MAIKPALILISDKKEPFDQLPPGSRRHLIDEILKKLGPIPQEQLPSLIIGANWLNSPALEHALLWKYSTYLHAKKTNSKIRQQILEDDIPSNLKPIISRYYFLQFYDDIDSALELKKKTYITLEDLAAYASYVDPSFKYNWSVTLSGKDDPRGIQRSPTYQEVEKLLTTIKTNSSAINTASPKAQAIFLKLKEVEEIMAQKQK